MMTPEEKQSIKEYFKALLITQKKTIRALEAKGNELEELQKKILYAQSKPDIQIPPSIMDKVPQLTEEIESLKNELTTVNLDIEKTKEEMKQADFGPGVDVDTLLAEFDSLLGDDLEKFELEKQIQAEKVDDDLEKLKKEMGLE